MEKLGGKKTERRERVWPAGSMTFSNRRIIAYADFLKVVFKFVQNMKRLAHKDSEEDDDVILLIPFSEKSGNRPQAREVSIRCWRTNSFFRHLPFPSHLQSGRSPVFLCSYGSTYSPSAGQISKHNQIQPRISFRGIYEHCERVEKNLHPNNMRSFLSSPANDSKGDLVNCSNKKLGTNPTGYVWSSITVFPSENGFTWVSRAGKMHFLEKHPQKKIYFLPFTIKKDPLRVLQVSTFSLGFAEQGIAIMLSPSSVPWNKIRKNGGRGKYPQNGTFNKVSGKTAKSCTHNRSS